MIKNNFVAKEPLQLQQCLFIVTKQVSRKAQNTIAIPITASLLLYQVKIHLVWAKGVTKVTDADDESPKYFNTRYSSHKCKVL